MTGRTWFWAFFPFEIYHCKENGILPGKPERSPQVQYCSPATRPTLLARPLLALSEPRTLLAWRWEVERRWVIQSRIHCQRKFTFNNQFIVLRKSFCVCPDDAMDVAVLSQQESGLALERCHLKFRLLTHEQFVCHSNALFFPLILSHTYPLGGLFKIIAHLCHTAFAPFNLPSRDDVPVTLSFCFLFLNSLQFVRMNGF